MQRYGVEAKCCREKFFSLDKILEAITCVYNAGILHPSCFSDWISMLGSGYTVVTIAGIFSYMLLGKLSSLILKNVSLYGLAFFCIGLSFFDKILIYAVLAM